MKLGMCDCLSTWTAMNLDEGEYFTMNRGGGKSKSC